MEKLIGVVDSPQFDTFTFQVSKAVHVVEKASNGFELLNIDALVKKINPLYITLTHYNKKKDEFEHLTIDIRDIVSGQYKITLLKEEK